MYYTLKYSPYPQMNQIIIIINIKIDDSKLTVEK